MTRGWPRWLLLTRAGISASVVLLTSSLSTVTYCRRRRRVRCCCRRHRASLRQTFHFRFAPCRYTCRCRRRPWQSGDVCAGVLAFTGNPWRHSDVRRTKPDSGLPGIVRSSSEVRHNQVERRRQGRTCARRERELVDAVDKQMSHAFKTRIRIHEFWSA